jgi:N-acetylmuramoyl-L-alanine amidase
MNRRVAGRIRWALLLPVILSFVLVNLLAAPVLAESRGRITVNNIRYWTSPEHIRVVLDLSEPAKFAENRLKNPDRVFLDLQGCALSARAREVVETALEGDGLLKSIRAGIYRPGVLRVVFDLKKLRDYKVFMLGNPSRLVVDVFGYEKLKPLRPNVRRIVIDPGHGGRDPGAIGLGGIKEKNVVLDVALRLRKILRKRGGYKVYLTRSKDLFLDLDERTVIANKKSADLFISIHANASRDKRTRGIETFLLNWTDNAAAKRVAARENRIYLKRMNKNRSDLGVILASLEMQNKRDESLMLAHYVQDSMVSSLSRRYGRVVDLGVKQALFHVLLGAEMPSVLVEVSFITNKTEARRLNTRPYRQRLADGIAAGIESYFKKITPVQKVAKR